MRTQAEWKVDTHIFWATGPTRAPTRCFISSAALLVKVMARISKGETPCSLISQPTLDVSTRVLPDPAPAMISRGPPGWVTASRCTGLRLSRRLGRSGMTRSRLPAGCDVHGYRKRPRDPFGLRSRPGRLPAMRAVVWHGKNDVRVDDVADPKIEEPTDALIRVTASAISGTDLHLYTKLWPVMEEGDLLGHEAVGEVIEVGRDVVHIAPGDRVVVPANVACGWCLQCLDRMYSQCETFQAMPARLGAQAEYVRVPQAQFGPLKVPDDVPTSATSSSPNCSPLPGRRSSSPTSAPATPSPSTAWARSARWRPASPSIGGRPG